MWLASRRKLASSREMELSTSSPSVRTIASSPGPLRARSVNCRWISIERRRSAFWALMIRSRSGGLISRAEASRGVRIEDRGQDFEVGDVLRDPDQRDAKLVGLAEHPFGDLRQIAFGLDDQAG